MYKKDKKMGLYFGVNEEYMRKYSWNILLKDIENTELEILTLFYLDFLTKLTRNIFNSNPSKMVRISASFKENIKHLIEIISFHLNQKDKLEELKDISIMLSYNSKIDKKITYKLLKIAH